MSTFTKGMAKVPGSGRKKGTPNNPNSPKQRVKQLSAEAIEDISKALNVYYTSGKFYEDICALDPKDRIKAMESHLTFFEARKTKEELNADNTGSNSLTELLISLSKQKPSAP